MAELVKPWENGGSLTVTYNGVGDGEAVFSSDANEGIDREMTVTFKGAGQEIERVVKQEGLREIFEEGFILADGGTFNVLKELPEAETYTRLSYIEANGSQYIDLGYVVQEDDVIEIGYVPTQMEAGRLYGSIDEDGNSVYWSFSAKNAYVRFGNPSSKTITNGIRSSYCIAQKGMVNIDSYEMSLAYTAMPTTPLYLGACRGADGSATALASFRCKRFAVRGEMELLPYRRNSDGKAGLLDIMSGRFYVSAATDFIAGGVVELADGYELIDYVTFDKDKLYDLGMVSASDTMDIQYGRNDTEVAEYLYGVVSSGHTASFTAYLASNGAWRFGTQLVRPNTADKDTHRTTIANGAATHDCSSMVLNASPAFTTAGAAVLGGYREADGVTQQTFSGRVYYVRMNDGAKLDWLPCRRTEDGKEGFWDCVSQRFIEPI